MYRRKPHRPYTEKRRRLMRKLGARQCKRCHYYVAPVTLDEHGRCPYCIDGICVHCGANETGKDKAGRPACVRHSAHQQRRKTKPKPKPHTPKPKLTSGEKFALRCDSVSDLREKVAIRHAWKKTPSYKLTPAERGE